MKKFLSLIRSSISSPDGKESSTRLIAYIITFLIVLFCLTFLGIEIYAAIIATGKFLISNEIIIIFGSLLTHQLTLLGINKYHESKQVKTENIKQVEKPVEEPVEDSEIIDP